MTFRRKGFLAPVSRRAFCAGAAALFQARRPVCVVPNFHPASCGWLTNFSMERVYCANSYFDHLDRVRDDSNYNFVLSECNNMIAMLNFKPERGEELKSAIRAGRVELPNAFFLESTTNLSGGEALVRLGVEGMRWQQRVFGVRPRFAWCIDICGTHPQMAQITAGLGLDAFVYCRGNDTGSALHWLEAPDRTRALCISPGHYIDLQPLFSATGPLNAAESAQLRKLLDVRIKMTPAGAPVLAFGGRSDYNLAPARKENPSAFLAESKDFDPTLDFRFTTLSKYYDAVAPNLASMRLPVMRGGGAYYYLSFWIQCPRVKTAFRRCEHQLQSAEMLASIASLRGKHEYPSQDLYHAWLQLFLNMDRNTLWGAAGGMVFEHETSWDANDRFQSIDALARAALTKAAQSLAGAGGSVALFNPLCWQRRDPVTLDAAAGPGEALPDGRVLCAPVLAPVSLTPAQRAAKPTAPVTIELPEIIETRFYSAKIDSRTGCLMSLKLKPGGREVLGGPANLLVAERPQKQAGDPGDHMLTRDQRDRLATSSDSEVRVTATRGPIALTVTADSTFHGGGACRRITRFYHESARIDFETTLNDIPDRTVVVAEFPLASDVQEVRRAIPYGFTHGAWPQPTVQLPGRNQGITPAVRWSHYQMDGAGLAILDRGLSGRELTGRTPVIFLLNTSNKYYGYPNAWLSGAERHHLEYAIVAHESQWREARVPHMAWEYNAQPCAVSTSEAKSVSFLSASPNVIVESMRRDGEFLEVRLAECLGLDAAASVTLSLPHQSAALTNLVGGQATPLRGGPQYQFPVRPQQIVTLRFRTATRAPETKPLLAWDPLVPAHKLPALHRYSTEKGHPPRGV